MNPGTWMDIELLISHYIDGDLTSDAEAELHHRLAVSPDARALFRAQLALKGVARDSRVLSTPSDDLRARLFDRLQGEGFSSAALPASVAAPVSSALTTTPRSIASPRLEGADRRRRRRALAWALVPLMLLALFFGRDAFIDRSPSAEGLIVDDAASATPSRPGEIAPHTMTPAPLSDAGPVPSDDPGKVRSLSADPSPSGLSVTEKSVEPARSIASTRSGSPVVTTREEAEGRVYAARDEDRPESRQARNVSSAAPPLPRHRGPSVTPPSDSDLVPRPLSARDGESSDIESSSDLGGKALADAADDDVTTPAIESAPPPLGNMRGAMATSIAEDSSRGDGMSKQMMASLDQTNGGEVMPPPSPPPPSGSAIEEESTQTERAPATTLFPTEKPSDRVTQEAKDQDQQTTSRYRSGGKRSVAPESVESPIVTTARAACVQVSKVVMD